MQAFFWMKGHGPYVCASYVITFVGIMFLVIFPPQQPKEIFKVMRANKMRKEAVNVEPASQQQPEEPKAE